LHIFNTYCDFSKQLLTRFLSNSHEYNYFAAIFCASSLSGCNKHRIPGNMASVSFQLNQWDLMVSGQLLYTLKNELRQKNTRAFLVGVFPMCPSRKASCVGNFLIAEVETFHWLHPGTPSKMPL